MFNEDYKDRAVINLDLEARTRMLEAEIFGKHVKNREPLTSLEKVKAFGRVISPIYGDNIIIEGVRIMSEKLLEKGVPSDPRVGIGLVLALK